MWTISNYDDDDNWIRIFSRMSQIRNVSNTKCLAVDPVNQVLRKTFPENFSEKVFQNSIIGRGGKSWFSCTQFNRTNTTVTFSANRYWAKSRCLLFAFNIYHGLVFCKINLKDCISKLPSLLLNGKELWQVCDTSLADASTSLGVALPRELHT